MRKYLLVYPNRDYGKLMWRDLKELDNVEFVDKPLSVNNILVDFLFRIHFSFKVNMKIELPLKRFWEKYYSLNHYDFNQEDEYVVLFTDPSLCNYRKRFLEKLKTKSNVNMVLVLINSFYRMRRIVEPMLECFDLIYTYDKRESETFGFSYYPTVYSMINIGNVEIVKHKCFFVGVEKDRLEKLIWVYDKLELCGCSPVFYISGVPKRMQKRRKGIVYNTWLPYKLVLKEVLSSEYIVEIMDKNNAGVTLRTLESICYNKKLITDNEKILESPFYRKDFIYLIDSNLAAFNDFFKCINEVNYAYDGRYSPVLFISRLERELNKSVI